MFIGFGAIRIKVDHDTTFRWIVHLQPRRVFALAESEARTGPCFLVFIVETLNENVGDELLTHASDDVLRHSISLTALDGNVPSFSSMARNKQSYFRILYRTHDWRLPRWRAAR